MPVLSLYSIGQRAPEVPELIAGLKVWFDSQRSLTLSGADITVLPNLVASQGGVPEGFTPGTVIHAQVSANQFASSTKPGILWGSSNCYYNVLEYGFAMGTGASVFMTIKPLAFQAEQIVFSGSNNVKLSWNGSGTIKFDSDFGNVTSSTNLTASTIQTMGFTIAVGGNYVFYKNGSSVGSGNAGMLNSFVSGALSGSSTTSMNTYIAEFMFYNTVLSGSDITTLHDYSNAKWF